jgi:hypothetical protein
MLSLDLVDPIGDRAGLYPLSSLFSAAVSSPHPLIPCSLFADPPILTPSGDSHETAGPFNESYRKGRHKPADRGVLSRGFWRGYQSSQGRFLA